MLRFQHFTAVAGTVEYGDAADPEAFEWLIEYSPLHNVESGVEYPPLLIMTAESDDRVVPMHARQFAAEIQHQASGGSEQPLPKRVETRRSRHGQADRQAHRGVGGHLRLSPGTSPSLITGVGST